MRRRFARALPGVALVVMLSGSTAWAQTAPPAVDAPAAPAAQPAAPGLRNEATAEVPAPAATPRPLPPSAAPIPAAPPGPVLLAPPPKPAPSVTDRWWFWAAVGGAVVLTATVLLVSTRGEDIPKTKLGNMEAF